MYDLYAFLLLYTLGVAGWGLFALLRAPVPPLLGALVVIGALRAAEAPIPPVPELLDPAVQIALGLFIGSKVTRDTVADLRNLIRPAFIVAVWALMLVFGFGPVLGRLSELDPVTAVLASSIGGLPEMMVLAMATGADIASVVVIKLVRAVIIMAVFPVLFQRVVGKSGSRGLGDRGDSGGARVARDKYADEAEMTSSGERSPDEGMAARDRGVSALRSGPNRWRRAARGAVAGLRDRPYRFLLTLAVAVSGALVLDGLGVPAGLMVGAIVSVATASVAGLPVRGFHPKLFSPLLVALGIMVTRHFGPDTGATLASGHLLWPLVLSTVVVFLTALVVAVLIQRMAGWDLPLSLLAAAPGGFTVMTAIAIHYGYDPFRVSMVHLARLLAIKTVVPVVFAFIAG